MDEEKPRVQRHLLIAGTGRAGTSFLVRYLAELGLDTHLGRFGENAAWDDEANAGLESAPITGLDGDLPYVVKSPWLYQFIDDLLTDNRFVTDAVVVPVRDLAEAAESRSIIERRAIHQNAPWISEFGRTWEQWCHVPGGITYSLNPIDQGRLLAVGFHHLLQRLIAADIPIIFLAFPRFIDDATYLFEKLRPILPRLVDHKTACSAHQRVADPAKVRVGKEIEALPVTDRVPSARSMGYASAESLELIAVRRELTRLRKQITALQHDAAAVEDQRRLDQAAASDSDTMLRNKLSAMETALAEATTANEQTARDQAEQVQILQQEIHQCRQHALGMTLEISRLNQQAVADAEQQHRLEMTLASMLTSRSWRLTRPYRAIGSRLRGAWSE
jgi:hypothetical protein